MPRRTFALLAVLLFMAVLVGCTRSTQDGLTEITVSEVTHSVFYAPQYAAIALGYFEEEGLEITLQNGGGADNVMTAVLSGQADIGFAGPEACIYVYNEGKTDYARVFAQVTKRDGSFIVGRSPDANFTYADFENAHVLGGRKGGMPYMTLQYVVDHSDADPAAVVLDTSIDFDLMVPAFTAGTGDYVTVFEPTASMLEQEGKGYILTSVGQDSGEIPYTAYFALGSYLEENADTVQRFTNALTRALQWVAQTDAAEIAQVVAPFFPDSDTDLLASAIRRYQQIDAWVTDPAMTEQSFTRLQDVMTYAGELKAHVPYTDLIDNSFARNAIS